MANHAATNTAMPVNQMPCDLRAWPRVAVSVFMSGGFLLALCRRQRREGGENGIDDRLPLRREIGVAAIAHPLCIAPVGQQARRLEPRHVPRHARLGGAQTIHQFADALLIPIPDDLQGAQASRFGQGSEKIVNRHHEA